MGPRYPLSDRLVVPDVLRGFAIFAMLVAHAAPLVPNRPGAVEFLRSSLNDVASPLFALVMGISAAIVIGRTPAAARTVKGTWIYLAQNTARGLILVLLGVWLATWGSWIAIVLAPLGFTLIVGAPIALLRSRWVAAIALVLAVVSAPIVSATTAAVAPWLYFSDPLTKLLIESFLTNPHYRVLNLLPFFLAGVVLLRHGFTRDRVLPIMLAIGVVAYAMRPILMRYGGDFDYFSGSYPDTLHDVGLVAAVYVAVVFLVSLTRNPLAAVVSAVFVPFRIIGTLALSIYVLQVAVVAWMAHPYPPEFGLVNYPLLALAIVVGVPAVGALWWYFLGDGPVERIMGFVTGRKTILGKRRVPTAA
ncbi:hypothetical protein GCM10009851_26200 [Herbiconiux moechotypicola]|uniref:DUF418 domain-containing protein n=2 Tax=Herbiconiux moechotypicola TaxID=637393 RepID=A0ABP5QLG9_9MICO